MDKLVHSEKESNEDPYQGIALLFETPKRPIFTDPQIDALRLREQLYREQDFERSSHRVVVPGEMAHYRHELKVNFEKLKAADGKEEVFQVSEQVEQVEIKSSPLKSIEVSHPRPDEPAVIEPATHLQRWHAMAARIAEIRDTGNSEIKIPEVVTRKVKAPTAAALQAQGHTTFLQ